MKINICYLILNLLLLIIARYQINKKNINLKYTLILLAIYLIFTLLTCSYFNSVMNNIYKLTYLNVKAYLMLLIIADIIIIYTMNKPVKLKYKIPNFILFILLVMIFITILPIVLGNKVEAFYVMDIGNAIILMDLSFIIFTIYITTISLIYLKYLISSSKEKLVPNIHKVPKSKLKKKKEVVLTREELLNYENKKEFYINGVDASIIFEDSNEDNIVKNYYLLIKDINAPLANGYTLEENKLLKNICIKLNVGNLTTIDLENLKILDKINSEEYQILKRVTKTN